MIPASPLNIGMIGTGYVGLVSGVCFAQIGHNVTCVDVDSNKILGLRQGIVPIHEPGLSEMIPPLMKSGRLSFETDIATILNQSDLIFLAVGTPSDQTTGAVDLRYIFKAVEQIATLATEPVTLVIKSTVPVGTAKRVREHFERINPSTSLAIISNPEFLREGKAVHDFMHPDRIVIGYEVNAPASLPSLIEALYHPLTSQGAALLTMSNSSAELVKYASNAFLATKITFINEMSDLCEASNGNIADVALGMGLDKRIGKDYLSPGPGFGGSCFPKDTLGLLDVAKQLATPAYITEAVIHSNQQRKKRMVQKIIQHIDGSAMGKRIAIWGVAFKADTDDIRDSPSLDIIQGLLDAGAFIQLYDPKAMEHAKRHFSESSSIKYAESALEAATSADALVVVTEWSEFVMIDPSKLHQTLSAPRVIDLRNLLDATKMAHHGIQYVGLGHTTINPC